MKRTAQVRAIVFALALAGVGVGVAMAFRSETKPESSAAPAQGASMETYRDPSDTLGNAR
jgi:3-deoxy-D-manno-octulosonic acid (KDO) 8-phosphate synthase